MELQAKDLRIGNLIIQDGSVIECTMRTLEWINDKDEHGYNDCEYIPLTEKWLVKFGINEIKPLQEGFKSYRITMWMSIHEHKNPLFKGKYFIMIGDKTVRSRVEYVHTLQNGYHFLREGKELTVKEGEISKGITLGSYDVRKGLDQLVEDIGESIRDKDQKQSENAFWNTGHSPCGDCSKQNSQCMSINCQYKEDV